MKTHAKKLNRKEKLKKRKEHHDKTSSKDFTKEEKSRGKLQLGIFFAMLVGVTTFVLMNME
jgi:hypothetical protein